MTAGQADELSAGRCLDGGAHTYDVLILAGGSARRLGGVDKPSVAVGGLPMLDRVLRATGSAALTVVVGPPRSTVRPVLWTREEPVGGGPVAALGAGLPLIRAALVLLLAADLPFLDAATVATLSERLPDQQAGRVMFDGQEHQWLCGAWRTDALRTALLGVDVHGARLRSLLSPLKPLEVTWDAGPGPAPWTDVDTETDLKVARSSA
ncbi:MAG: NTP transferase domain-containing protein [Mycobacteriales bacterium]